MNIIEMAKEADIYVAHLNKPMTDKEVRLAFLERFAALVRAEVLKEQALQNLTDFHQYIEATEPVKQEPVAWLFQNEETGRTMCVDVQQVEWNFEKNNPRLQKIHPLYAAPVDAKAIRAEALEEAAEYVDRNLYTAGEYAEKLRERAATIRGLK
jgi:hypothetical protein